MDKDILNHFSAFYKTLTILLRNQKPDGCEREPGTLAVHQQVKTSAEQRCADKEPDGFGQRRSTSVPKKSAAETEKDRPSVERHGGQRIEKTQQQTDASGQNEPIAPQTIPDPGGGKGVSDPGERTCRSGEHMCKSTAAAAVFETQSTQLKSDASERKTKEPESKEMPRLMDNDRK